MSPAAKSELTRAQLLALMAYADGEVDPHDLAALEEELANSPESVQVVESIRGLGERVRTGLPVTPDVTDSVMARVTADAADPADPRRPAQIQGAKVLDLAAARARRVKVGAAFASFVAVAAAVALWFGRPTENAGGLVPEFATAAMGVQVQQVDSQAMVYSIPALHSNASSVVVWLGDDSEDSAGKLPDAAPQPSTKASITQ